MEFNPVIGLEIHAGLKTRTKMFCGCLNEPLPDRPNKNICPICLGHPGALPVANREALRQVLRVGLSLGGQLADYSEFDRKSYFYPDIPKGYQISQYAYPLVAGGALNGVAIRRVHLEEDTARSIHPSTPLGTGDKKDYSLIDFNRAGVPLLELVTEPVLHSARAAADFARELQLVFRYLGASDANMERGEMRVEANISVSRSDLKNSKRSDLETTGSSKSAFLRTGEGGNPAGTDSLSLLGTKVEVKNLNSFRAVERAIEYELARQSKLLASGQKVEQETRGWDDAGGKTFPQRSKESAHDYRYFPDPDLPSLEIGKIKEFDDLAATLPEMPWARRERYRNFGFLKDQDIEQLVADRELAGFFDRLAVALGEKNLLKRAANILMNDVAGRRKTEPAWLPEFDHFTTMIKSNLPLPQIRSSILSGLKVKSMDDKSLPVMVEKIIAANPKVAADYRAGKAVALQYLVGQGMKESKGAANPQVLERLLKEALK